MKILVAGGTGFLGKKICRLLTENGHFVVILTRQPKPEHETPLSSANYWDGQSIGPWASHLDTTDVVINLSGENIFNKRWTKKQKLTLLTSRLNPTQTLIKAIKRQNNPNIIFINASAIGYYDQNEQETVSESSPHGTGFLSEICIQWESAAKDALTCCRRVAMLRTGIVLGENGGVLKLLFPLFKLYLGGHIGTGQQWFPWIHIDDIPAIILHIIETDSLSGPINLTAPTAIRMQSFCALLGKTLNRPSWLHAPAFALNFLLGERAGMILRGQKVVPKKLIKSGYTFKFKSTQNALTQLMTDQAIHP